MNEFQLIRTEPRKLLSLRQLKNLKLESEEIKVEGIEADWEVEFTDKSNVMLKDGKEDHPYRLHSLDLATNSLKQEVEVGKCGPCDKFEQPWVTVAKEGNIFTVSKCQECGDFHAIVWMNGQNVWSKEVACWSYSSNCVHHDSKFLIFKSGQEELTKISWKSLEEDKKVDAQTIHLNGECGPAFEIHKLIVDGDKVILKSLNNESALYLADLSNDSKIMPLPSIFPPGGKEESINTMMKVSKNRYLIAAQSPDLVKRSYSLIDKSCKVFGRVEVESEVDSELTFAGELHRTGKQLVLARIKKEFHLLGLRGSKLALVRRNLTLADTKPSTNPIKTLGSSTFCLQGDKNLFLVKLKF